MILRRRLLPLFAVLVSLTALSALPTSAEAQFRFGLQAGYGSSDGIDPGFGLGLRGILGLSLAENGGSEDTALGAVSAMISLERYFPDCDTQDCSLWELNGNLILPLFAARGFTPYLGAGLGLSRFSVDEDSSVSALTTDTNADLNLLGGVRYRGTRVTTFGELRQAIGGGDDPFYLTFGILLGG